MLPRQLKLHIRWDDEYNKLFGVLYDAAYNLSCASLHCVSVSMSVYTYLYLSRDDVLCITPCTHMYRLGSELTPCVNEICN